MARRRKGTGGRVTPKGTRPRHWDGGPTLVSALPAGLDALLPRFDDDAAIFRDAEASSFVTMFPAASASDVIDLTVRGDEPPAAGEVLAVLADLGPRPPQRVVDTVAAFAAYGGSAAPKAAKVLRSFAAKPSVAASGFGRGTITSTRVVEDIFGETNQYLFGLRYPDGTEGAAAVLIDRLLGGVLKDALVMPDVATFTDLVDDSDDMTVRPADLAEAAAAIDDAYEINDMTLGIDEIIDDDVNALRPLIETILASSPRTRPEPASVSAKERDRVIDEFVGSIHDTQPEVSDDVLSWTGLAVDFAADRGSGDPLKWGPNTIVTFLEWSTRKVMADPADLRRIPEMLRLFVPWAHARAGWDDRHVGAALDAIDRTLPLFDEAISEPGSLGPVQQAVRDALAGIDFSDPDAVAAAIEQYNVGLEPRETTIAPAGGSHPEPFDPSGLDDANGKVAAIAELASTAARALFDDEYVTLVRRVVADAARVDPDLFARGRPDIWASGVVYAVAQLNDIIGSWGPMSVFSDDLTSRLAGAPGTITAKAAKIRDRVGDDRWSRDPRHQHSGARVDLSDLGIDFGGFGGSSSSGDVPSPAIVHDRLPEDSAFVLRCDLVDLPGWRTIRVPASITLYELHLVLQRIFDWDDYHLHRFTIAGRGYTSDPEADWGGADADDLDVRLDELLRPGSVFDYLYDFGDNWQIRITVGDMLEPDPVRPRFDLLAGAGDAPPEDCGGTGGYHNLVSILADPEHPEHDELREWAGDFRPGSFDLESAAARLRNA